MAVPASVSIRDLTGRYTLNKKLSDDPEPILEFLRLKHDQEQQRCFDMVKRLAIARSTTAITTTITNSNNNNNNNPPAAAQAKPPLSSSPSQSQSQSQSSSPTPTPPLLTMHLTHSHQTLETRTLIGPREISREERRLDFSTRESPNSPFGQGIRTRSRVVDCFPPTVLPSIESSSSPSSSSSSSPSYPLPPPNFSSSSSYPYPPPPPSPSREKKQEEAEAEAEEEIESYLLRNSYSETGVEWEGGKVVRVVTEGPGWVADGAWGVARIGGKDGENGERRHVRLVVVTRFGGGGGGGGGGGEEMEWEGGGEGEEGWERGIGKKGKMVEQRRARMVYDYLG